MVDFQGVENEIEGEESDDDEINRLMADAHDLNETNSHPGLQLLADDSSASVSREIFLPAKERGKSMFF